ncbi:hypothetical protein SAMN04489731_111176 [Amycolatopsis regifaucium]|nr:hypothetical protein SAMN04489731_111176 [Amycolatopsis regifaucium]
MAPFLASSARKGAIMYFTPARPRALALDPVDGRHVADVAGTQDISFEAPPSPVGATLLGYPVSKAAARKTLFPGRPIAASPGGSSGPPAPAGPPAGDPPPARSAGVLRGRGRKRSAARPCPAGRGEAGNNGTARTDRPEGTRAAPGLHRGLRTLRCPPAGTGAAHRRHPGGDAVPRLAVGPGDMRPSPPPTANPPPSCTTGTRTACFGRPVSPA